MRLRPPRRWFRFGLRTMFVVLTVLSVLGSWIVSEKRRNAQRRLFSDSLYRRGISRSSHLHGQSYWPLSLLERRNTHGDFIDLKEGLFTQSDLDQISYYYPDAAIYIQSDTERKLIKPNYWDE